jgi:hypothetical protein
VVSEPDRIEANPLGSACHLEEFRPQHTTLDLGQLHTDFHDNTNGSPDAP